MNNKIKKTQTILFASLIAAMILPFSMTDIAVAETKSVNNAIYDLQMVSYIEEVISKEGKTTKQRTMNSHTLTVTNDVTEIRNDVYRIKSNIVQNQESKTDTVFTVMKIDDKVYRLVSKQMGIDKTFTADERDTYGSGSSNFNHAIISLHDRERGTPNTLELSDNHNGCGILNQAEFIATVKPDVVDVNWQAHPFYMHYCFYPHEWKNGYVQHGTEKVHLEVNSNHDDRRGSHSFTNHSGGTTYYSVSAVFKYGGW